MKIQKLRSYFQKPNNFKPGQEIEFFGPEIETFTQVVEAIYDEEGNNLDAARHPLQIVQIKVDRPYIQTT